MMMVVIFLFVAFLGTLEETAGRERTGTHRTAPKLRRWLVQADGWGHE